MTYLDTLRLSAERIVVAVLWWNPLTWMALRRAHVEREYACDDAVLAGGAVPSGYAEQLLRQALTVRGGSGAVALSMLPGAEPQLRRRVRSILDPDVRRGTPRGAVAGLVLGALLFVSCISVSVDVEPDEGGSMTLRADGVSVRVNGDVTTVSIDSGELIATIGEGVRFASDTEIASVVGGGRLQITDRRDDPSREIEVSEAGGSIGYRYRLGGVEQALDSAGREWFESTLLELFRRAGVDHEARVGRLHDHGGLDAVFEELEQIPSGFVSGYYLEDLLALPGRDAATERLVLERLPELLDSTFERARIILVADLERVAADPALRAALVGALGSLEESPFELRRALTGLLVQVHEDETAFAAVLSAGGGLRSDFERAELLGDAVAYIEGTGPALDAWFEVAEGIGGGFERARVLRQLLEDRPDLDAGVRVRAMEVAAGIDGDFERAQLLIQLAEQFRTAEERAAYLEVARGIRSDFERGRALATLDGYLQRN